MKQKKAIVRRRPSRPIGARVFYDTDGDLVKWWDSMEGGTRSRELVLALRERKDGKKDADRLKRLEQQVTELTEMVRLIGQMLEAGIVVKAGSGGIPAPENQMSDAEAQILEQSLANQW